MTNTFNHPIFDTMIDAFDAYARANDNFTTDESLRDMLILDACHTHTFTADFSDDCTILRCRLDDELHYLTLIAFYDRDTLELRTLIFDADATTSTIPLP